MTNGRQEGKKMESDFECVKYSWAEIPSRLVDTCRRGANGGLYPTASDVGLVGQAEALANGSIVRNFWCGCDGGEDRRSAFYARRDGTHGWACRRCLGVIQTG